MFNKKGMAISGIIYSAVLLFISILFGILLLLINRRNLFKSLYDNTVSMLESSYTEYRVIAKDGFCDQEGTGYDSVTCGAFDYEFTLYSEKNLINEEEFSLSKINNQGLKASLYDLEITNGTAIIEEGIASLIFDSSTTLVSVNNLDTDEEIDEDFGYNTIYMEIILNTCGSDIMTFGENNTISFSGNSTICDSITLKNNTNTTTGINLDYTLGDTLKLMLIYNEESSTYDIIVNGVKLENTITNDGYELLNFEEFSITNFNGKLNDLRFSSNIITEYEAINITNDKYELKYKLNKLNTELIYTLIEYR